jgi:hypothetical protein
LTSLVERVAQLEVSVLHLEADVQNLPTRPELEAFKATLQDVVQAQKDIMETQKEIVKFIDKWKFAGVILLGLGALLSKVIDWFMTGWGHLTSG